MPQKLVAVVIGLILGASPAVAGSYNIDFGSGSPPSISYAGAGLPGTWNVVGVLPSAERLDLVDLTGEFEGARIYMIGGDELLSADDPGTTGDDEALLDDMLIGFNDPIDVCVWVEGLEPGDYEVLTYALTPVDPELLSRVRVDDGDPGPVLIGGAWSGSHEEGVSFARHLVTVGPSGTIGLHSGEISAEVQSGINGIQIRSVEPAGLGELGFEHRPGRAFPNPAGGTQEIRFSQLPAGAAVTFAIADVSGRILLRDRLEATSDGRVIAFWEGRRADGSLVAPGVYYARIGGQGAVRLVRVR